MRDSFKIALWIASTMAEYILQEVEDLILEVVYLIKDLSK